MSKRVACIYFYQPPFTANSEQMGCYYFNILEAVELCRSLNTAIVPPLFPLCPRDNTMVEVYNSAHWEKSILTIDSVSSAEVLDYTNVSTLSLNEFIEASGKRVTMKHSALSVNGIEFVQDLQSPYLLLDMTSRWDLQGRDTSIFYLQLYRTLPFREPNTRITVNFKKPYLGVHWRRGDRGNVTMGEIGKRLWAATEPEQVAKQINARLTANPAITEVYISTNSGSKRDRQRLTQLLNAQVYCLERPSAIAPVDHWRWDLTDLFLCSQADDILLSPGGLEHSSAFGRLIYAEALRKNPKVTVTSMPYI
jgi:hypothetical protein